MGVKMYKSKSEMCDTDLEVPTTEDVVTEAPEAMESNVLNVDPRSASFVEQQNGGLGIGGTFIPNSPQTIDQLGELSQQDIEQLLKEIS